MYRGSCLCGSVRYEIKRELSGVTHCHCTMCQKQHGALFSTYAGVPRADLEYFCEPDDLSSYQSSESATRRFCRECGSNLEWASSVDEPDTVYVAIASLDSEYKPQVIDEIHTDTRVKW
ncbi:MAG: hypothetical protein CMQ20_12730 [Gammaproteobacteria bacterium]|jgi:hypothetical protein|nr:hypothetical protein [Gammaproteobacteria bacterium]